MYIQYSIYISAIHWMPQHVAQMLPTLTHLCPIKGFQEIILHKGRSNIGERLSVVSWTPCGWKGYQGDGGHVISHLVDGQDSTADHLGLGGDEGGHDQAGAVTQTHVWLHKQRLPNKHTVSQLAADSQAVTVLNCIPAQYIRYMGVMGIGNYPFWFQTHFTSIKNGFHSKLINVTFSRFDFLIHNAHENIGGMIMTILPSL